MKTVRLNIERLNSSGQGVALDQGFTYFVNGALPGEDITGIILEKKKNYAVVDVKTWHQESPHRIKTLCEHFQDCGGCQLLHLNYTEQLHYKTKRLEDALLRIGKFKPPLPIATCIQSNNTFYYRSKIQFHASATSPQRKEAILGFYRKNSHELVPIHTCHVHNSLGNKIYHSIQHLLKNHPLEAYNEISSKGYLRHVIIRANRAQNQALVIFVVTKKSQQALLPIISKLKESHPEIIGILENIHQSKKNTILSDSTHVLFGQDFFEEILAGISFHVSASSFFQINPEQAETLFTQAIALADIKKTDRILDAFCGTGTLTLIASKNCKEIIGIELHGSSIVNAKKNALNNGINNAFFHCGKVEELAGNLGDFDIVFLDPPRKGCDPQFIDFLGKMAPKQIIYISCDPSTLARDLAILTQSNYILSKVVPVDMFPQTTHLETIAKLTRIS